MTVLNWLKTQKDNVTVEMKRFKSKKFLDAVTAGCALVAYANGIIKPEEKAKMAGFIQRNDALSVYDMAKVIDSFEKHVKSLEFDLFIGKGEALKAIGNIKKQSDEARLLIRVCCAIGAADGDFDPDEKAVVTEICNELGLNPSEFGISIVNTDDDMLECLPEGTLGSPYEYMLDVASLECKDYNIRIEGLPEGVRFENSALFPMITGMPEKAGEYKLTFEFQKNDKKNIRLFKLIINEKLK